jgi:hypothetical protein
MDRYFREALEGLQTCAQHLMTASQEIQQAGAALVQVTTAALHAKDEHEDLRETVDRLERLVLEQGTDIRALRLDVQALRRREGDAP